MKQRLEDVAIWILGVVESAAYFAVGLVAGVVDRFTSKEEITK